MAYPNKQESSSQTKVDVYGGEPLADSGFENQNPEPDFVDEAEE